ncbi:aldehyde dehydrogenase (NADP(+)) [Amnibacterium endophyticum]|uniref:Aldehyde dehydrogenase (NADP(+)) n=1 Tax=Amnibacterium endophyticum TaxID=2109337 RepID=A0ABW4LET0_9MICO
MTDTAPAELDALLDAAVAAAAVLRDRPLTERAAWLRAAAEALDADAEALLPLAEEESHLPRPRLTGELARTTFQLRLFADEVETGAFLDAVIDHADPDWGMGPRPDLRRMLVPLGPVAVWAASNFPFAFSVAGGDTASALAAGCPVLLVAHPGHPRLSERTARVLRDALTAAGAPDGVFALVEGQDAGRTLIQDPRVTAGAFTGSLRGGRALFDLAAGREAPIPFYGELGSTNPAVVTRGAAGARAAEIAEGFAGSMSLGVGQFCTKPGVLLVPAGSEVPALVAERLGAMAGAPMLNGRIRDGYGQALEALAAHEVVEVLAGSVDPDADPAPTLLRTSAAEVVADPRPLTAEVFGPAALVVEYADDAELLDAVRAFEGQLTATVHGEPDEQVVPALLDTLSERAGRVLWGGWPTGVTVSYAQQHGGPYPATTAVGTTSVGTAAMERFLRPVAYQGLPDALLPPPLRDGNPWAVPQRIDGTRP